MNHHPAVPPRPARPARHLLPRKPVLQPQPIPRKRQPKEQVTKPITKINVPVIPHLNRSVRHPKRIPKVRPQSVPPYLRRPPRQRPTIEHAHPLPLRKRLLSPPRRRAFPSPVQHKSQNHRARQHRVPSHTPPELPVSHLQSLQRPYFYGSNFQHKTGVIAAMDADCAPLKLTSFERIQ